MPRLLHDRPLRRPHYHKSVLSGWWVTHFTRRVSLRLRVLKADREVAGGQVPTQNDEVTGRCQNVTLCTVKV
jgi:hypothetical protein